MESIRLLHRRRWMRCSPKSHDGRMGRYPIVRTLLSFGTPLFPFPPSLSTDPMCQGRFRIHGPTLPGLPRRRHPKGFSPPPVIHLMPTLPADPPALKWRSVDAHHRSPEPRHRTLVNGDRMGCGWQDARPGHVSQIPALSITQWECADRWGGGLGGVH